jgi:hypothetical protein
MEDLTLDDEQRFNSIALDSQAQQPFRNTDAMALNIAIESFAVVESTMRKHVEYKIAGEVNGDKFEVRRRYKEFRILHRILTQTWPGCILPKLPPKKAVVKPR